jgi:hypothetical protein
MKQFYRELKLSFEIVTPTQVATLTISRGSTVLF